MIIWPASLRGLHPVVRLLIASLFRSTFVSFPQYTVNPEKPELYGQN